MSARMYAQLNGVPLAVTPEFAAALQDAAAAEIQGVPVTAEQAARLTRAMPAAQPGATGIGVISIGGVIGPQSQSDYVDTTVERIGAEFDAMLQDARIGTIVLNIDSPGGLVYGTPELAAKLAAGRSQKLVIAYTGGLMASAAYWLGSAAHEIVAAPSAQVGSIGVYTIHADVSRMLENIGVHVTIIKAGANKAEGAPFAPLSATDRANIQARIDDYYEQFVGAVAAHRGTTPDRVRGGYGQGSVVNARAAVAAGLVDRVATFEDLLSGLAAGSASRNPARATAPDVAPTMLTAGFTGTTANSVQATVTFTVPTLEQASAPQAPAVPTSPAPVARSATVSTETTAATQAAIPDTRDKDIRALAREHNKDITWLDAAIDSGKPVAAIQREILAEYRAQASATAINPATSHTTGVAPSVHVGADRATQKPWAGFGEFLAAVKDVATPGASFDPRLAPLAAATGMSQGVPADGGFLVAPQFSSNIWNRLTSDPNSLLSMTDNYPVEGESLTFPANAETSRATGSRYGGIQGYWINEADQITKSKPKFRNVKVEPQQMAVLVYVTEKLLRNSPVAMAQYVERAAAEEIAFMTGDAIINGSGAGQPKGILTSNAKVQVSKETNQAAATVLQENVSKMWARLHPRCRATAVWLHNVDVEPALDTLSTVVKNVAGTENVGGYANKVFDSERRTLKGRPLIACEFAATLGTVGDLMLVDLQSYLTGTRSGVDAAVSMHVRFEYAEQAFRFIYEVDGQPWIDSPITPFKGSNTLSPFVVLQSR